jgi:hypothetical protein
MGLFGIPRKKEPERQNKSFEQKVETQTTKDQKELFGEEKKENEIQN